MNLRQIARHASSPLLFFLSVASCTAEQQLGERPSADAGDVPNAGDVPGDGNGDDAAIGEGYSRDASKSPTKDTTAPSVTLSASSTNITAAGNLTLSAVVADESAIAKVVISSGGDALKTLTAPPYAVTLPITSANNGTYSFTAEATDAEGNVGASNPVTVTVTIQEAPTNIPTFVAASTPTLITAESSLTVATPAGVQTDDLLITFIDADEGTGAHTLSTPAGWTLLGGFPIHNVSTAHSPYIVSPTQNHGTWIFHKFANANEPGSASFAFQRASTSRGVMLAYRGVDKANPIHDKSGMGFYGAGETNGLGSGNTTLTAGRQVNLIATATTAHPTYTVVQTSPGRVVRVNTNEQPNGLNLIVYDSAIFAKIFSGPFIQNKQSPSGLADGFLFSATTLVLTPQ